MKRAAELTFAHKYRKTHFYIYESKELCPFSNDGNEIYLCEKKICFRVLRCFGQMISQLSLKCSRSTAIFWTYLDEYVKQYCANNLTQLAFWSRMISFENLQITFPSVENVRFIDCKLNKTITKFNARFPKMRSLEFAIGYRSHTEVDEQHCIEAHFPYLEHLSINFPGTRAKEIGFQEKNVLNALKLNRGNLRSLNLCDTFNFHKAPFIRAISEMCESLDTLQITGYPLQNHGKIHFKNVKTFKIDHLYSNLRSPISLTFDTLETLECHSVSSLPPFLFDFVRMNPSITKMRLSFTCDSLTRDEIIKMKKSFAFVKEIEQIDILIRDIIPADISFFVNSFKSLKKLILKPTFDCKSDYTLESIKSLQHIAWTIGIK